MNVVAKECRLGALRSRLKWRGCSAMAYCGHCGAELVPGDEFCRSCGTALADVASVAGPPAETSARKKGRIALIVAAIVLGLLLFAGVVYLFA